MELTRIKSFHPDQMGPLFLGGNLPVPRVNSFMLLWVKTDLTARKSDFRFAVAAMHCGAWMHSESATSILTSVGRAPTNIGRCRFLLPGTRREFRRSSQSPWRRLVPDQACSLSPPAWAVFRAAASATNRA